MKTMRALVYCVCFFIVLCMCCDPASAEHDTIIFEFEVIETQKISGYFSTASGEEIIVDWGDGSRETAFGGQYNYSKDYESPSTVTVKVYGKDKTVLTGFTMMESGANIRFDLKDLPAGVAVLDVRGDNTVTGDIGDLPAGMANFRILGGGVAGDIAGLPEGLTSFDGFGCEENPISGDVKNLPGGILFFRIRGATTVGGDISDLPEKLRTVYLYGKNTLSGDVKDFPGELALFLCHGENTITGDIGDLPAGMTLFDIAGSNRVEGNLNGFPPGINHFVIMGDNIVSGYSPGREWAKNMRHVAFNRRFSRGLSAEEVDNLLIDFAKTTWVQGAVIRLDWNNAPRSEASDGAVAALEAMGVRVITRR